MAPSIFNGTGTILNVAWLGDKTGHLIFAASAPRCPMFAGYSRSLSPMNMSEIDVSGTQECDALAKFGGQDSLFGSSNGIVSKVGSQKFYCLLRFVYCYILSLNLLNMGKTKQS